MQRYLRVICTHTHKSVTPTCENRVTCGDTQGLSIHTFMLPRPVRNQVACGDALYGNPHTFRRQKCLKSLHAFKGDNDPYLHFEDDNVFSHCMPSKATMSLSTFRRRQCLQSLHAFKRRQCLHLNFEDDNVFTSKTSISFSPVLRRTRRPLFVRFKKKETENENENELNKKRRNFNVFMPSRVLLLGFALVVGRVKIQFK